MAYTPQRPPRSQAGSSEQPKANPPASSAPTQGGMSFQDALLGSHDAPKKREQSGRDQPQAPSQSTESNPQRPTHSSSQDAQRRRVTPEWRQNKTTDEQTNPAQVGQNIPEHSSKPSQGSSSSSQEGQKPAFQRNANQPNANQTWQNRQHSQQNQEQPSNGQNGERRSYPNSNAQRSNQSGTQGETGRKPVTAEMRAQWAKEKAERQAQYEKEKVERQARYERRKRIADELGQIKLELVFEALGNVPGLDVYSNQDGDASKWKIASKGNIITKDQTWQNTMTYKKGFGGVSLVAMALDLDWGKAVDWMIEKFGEDLDDSIKADLDESKADEAVLFAPPDANPESTGLARRYLIEKRGLPPSLVDREIKKALDTNKGGLYGAHPTGNNGEPMTFRHNIIFRGPASAEVRGIEGSNFKGCLGGSLPEHSGYRVAHSGAGEPIIAMTEAAIDALSYHALFPGRFVVSTNGSGSRFPLQYKLAVEMVNRDYGIRAAFDADAAGDFPAQRLCNAFILRKILMHKLKVDEEQVDEWFMDETIEFLPSESPHENCFNLGWNPLMPKFESKLVQSDDDGQMHMVWVDTGEMAPPAMRISIKRDLHPDWKRTSEKVIQIGERAFGYIMNDLNLRRDRPLLTKDWNEDLLQLGSRYIQDYERCAKNNFEELPELPASLAAMREETNWVFTTPPPTSSFQPKR